MIPDLSDPSKLKVGLEFLPNESYGDYWVVFAGPDEGPYDYGIVSGKPLSLFHSQSLPAANLAI